MGMPGRHERFVVTDMNDAEKLLCLIHDESFDIDDIKYDADEGNLDIPFMRYFHGENKRIVKKTLFRTTYEVPVLNCVLRIGNVIDYKLVDTQKIGTYPMNEIEYDGEQHKVVVETNVPLELSAQVSKLHLEYFELDFEGKARISNGWFPISWESGPRFVDDK